MTIESLIIVREDKLFGKGDRWTVNTNDDRGHFMEIWFFPLKREI